MRRGLGLRPPPAGATARPARVETDVAAARQLMRSGNFAEADRRLQALSKRVPANPDVLGLGGIAAAKVGHRDRAITLLQRSLAPGAPPAVFRRNLNALYSLVAATGTRTANVESLLAIEVPIADAAKPQSPEDIAIVLSLARYLGMHHRFEEGIRLLDAFYAQFKDTEHGLAICGVMKVRAGRYEEGLADLSVARLGKPLDGPPLLALAMAAEKAQMPELAKEAIDEFVSRFPLYLSKERPSQQCLIGVANWMSQRARQSVSHVHFPGNFISQLHDRHKRDYRFLSVLCNSRNGLDAITRTPVPDIVYNSVVNPEYLYWDTQSEFVQELLSYWDRPVLNHPNEIKETHRLSASNLYAGIENLLVPNIVMLSKERNINAIVEELEEGFRYPIIVRGLVEQEGRNVFLAEDQAELITAVQSVEAEPYFYVIQYYESKHERGRFRKLRAAVAGDVIQILRVDYDVNWSVHGRKSEPRVMFYLENHDLLEEERRICMEPDTHLGPGVMKTLREMRRRNPLDVFGFDFDVLADGRILFFEANAAMNLLSSADRRIINPPDAEHMFMTAFRDLVAQKMQE